MAHATYETQGRRLAVVALLAAAGAGLLPMGTEVGFGVTLQNDPTPAAPGAIVRAAVSSVANTVATNVVTVARPAGTAPGDTLVACLTLNGSTIRRPAPGFFGCIAAGRRAEQRRWPVRLAAHGAECHDRLGRIDAGRLPGHQFGLDERPHHLPRWDDGSVGRRRQAA